jgi:uncharacterized protein YycO
MKIIVVSSHGPMAYLIKLFTMSKWNHSAIYFEDENLVIDADTPAGVNKYTLVEFISKYPNYVMLDINVPDLSYAKAFAKNQIGKEYDWTAIFSFIFRRDWQEEDKWFCSELVEATLIAGGLKRFRDSANRITPYLNWVAT